MQHGGYIVDLIEQIYVPLINSQMMTEVEIWRLEEDWNVVSNIFETFFN